MAEKERPTANAITRFFQKPFFQSYITIGVLWALFAIIIALLKGGFGEIKINNFLIFRQVFWHAIDFQSLYAYYPAEYHDHNLYGPLFSLIIAPFAVMPKFLGLITWLLALGASIYVAILKLPLNKTDKIIIYWFISNEVISAMLMGQFNIAIAAIMIGAYAAVKSDKNWLATLLILLGTLTKIYAVLGFIYLLFTRRKWNFIVWTIVWSAILFVAPMAISSPEYIIGQYHEWIVTLLDKNSLNVKAGLNNTWNYYQNISALGMTHRISGKDFSDLFILIPAAILYLLPFVRVRQWKAAGFQWGVVASSLMCIILFSTGSESSGYIIAMLGVIIWYLTAPGKRNWWDTALLIFALILGSFGTTDLVPRSLQRAFIRPYSLKALPVLLVWLKLIWEMLNVNYLSDTSNKKSKP